MHALHIFLNNPWQFKGVTLLAFGNGAPDVFSAIAAVRSSQDGDVGLALGALLGKYHNYYQHCLNVYN